MHAKQISSIISKHTIWAQSVSLWALWLTLCTLCVPNFFPFAKFVYHSPKKLLTFSHIRKCRLGGKSKAPKSWSGLINPSVLKWESNCYRIRTYNFRTYWPSRLGTLWSTVQETWKKSVTIQLSLTTIRLNRFFQQCTLCCVTIFQFKPNFRWIFTLIQFSFYLISSYKKMSKAVQIVCDTFYNLFYLCDIFLIIVF